ncbi:MAG: cytochrome c3 family protein [Ginsengibacter sp.]
MGNVASSSFEASITQTRVGDKDGIKYVGSEVCASCHKNIYESHLKTAHFLDSRPASKEFIKGSFLPGQNKFVYNKWMEVLLEQKNNAFYQTAFINGIEYQSEPFGIVIGSGNNGQSYLYWDGNKLYQLPVSYYANLNSWCNSPGFPINFIKFDRIIPGNCMECHTTYAKLEEDSKHNPTFDKSQIIYGIDCERCHGPAEAHVNYQQENSGDKRAKYIVSIEKLARQQRLDGCALCHSGFRKEMKPAFSFTIGDTLNNYSHAIYTADSASTLDVHGNQYGLLTSSKCFRMSQMDCSSCHNVHDNEGSNLALYSQRCVTCHASVQHSTVNLTAEKKVMFNSNCIDCHMPLLPSRKIVLSVGNSRDIVPYLVRTHTVDIYREKTKEFIKKLKSMH